MNKQARYERLKEQVQPLLAKSPTPMAAMATISAVLFHKMESFSWCGFYYLHRDELVVGPYQGPVACQTLAPHTGVCWAAIDRNETLVVPDVEAFPGHIACDSRTRSEVVVPIHNATGEVVAVFDVDSHSLNSFDEIDARCLRDIIQLIEPLALCLQ